MSKYRFDCEERLTIESFRCMSLDIQYFQIVLKNNYFIATAFKKYILSEANKKDI